MAFMLLAVFCMLLAAYNSGKNNMCGTVLNIGFAIINVLLYGIERIT